MINAVRTRGHAFYFYVLRPHPRSGCSGMAVPAATGLSCGSNSGEQVQVGALLRVRNSFRPRTEYPVWPRSLHPLDSLRDCARSCG